MRPKLTGPHMLPPLHRYSSGCTASNAKQQHYRSLGPWNPLPSSTVHTSSPTTSLPAIYHPLTSPLMAISECSSSKASDTVVVAPRIPALKQFLVDLILADKYIDLGELPPAKDFSKPLSFLFSGLGGQVVLLQAADLAQAKGLVPDSSPPD